MNSQQTCDRDRSVPEESHTQISRRRWFGQSAVAVAGGVMWRHSALLADVLPAKARIAITLDLEMARNFPTWEDKHWDYEKGNLNRAAKEYSVKAGQLVRQRGGRIHYFCVGSTLEQEDVRWLAGLAADGHPLGNHTYDHVNLLATRPADLQFRFQRSPWLIAGRQPLDVIRHNIRLTTEALKHRLGVDNRGFRTPGGFYKGLSEREDLQHMLLELGFTWVSSKYPPHLYTEPQVEPTEEIFDSIVAAQAEAQPFVYPSGLIEIPMSPISDIGGFRTGRWRLEWFLEAVGRAVQWTIDNRAVFDFLAHPSCLGVVDPECQTLKLICDLVERAGDRAQLVDLDQIAAEHQGLTSP
ncbi:MAG: polysaccharide deacetylase family protein [Pirellulaceae bacterium]|nr:polysaccharide deacetylase family protein [Pirellulaceae bacterium]